MMKSDVLIVSFYNEMEKIAIAAELRIAGGFAERVGLKRLASKLTRAGHTIPDAIQKALLYEPKMQPKFMKGRHIMPKKWVKKLSAGVAHEPILGAIQLAPTTPIGSAAYLAARGAAGKAVGMPGMAMPFATLRKSAPKRVRKMYKPAKKEVRRPLVSGAAAF